MLTKDTVGKNDDVPLLCSLRTNFHKRGDRFVFSKELRVIKKKSCPVKAYCFESDLSEFDAQMLVNIDSKSDGVYELRVCNIEKDWESGCVEGWNWVLVDYNPTVSL